MLNKKIFLLENFLVQSFCLHFLMDFFTMNINESNRLEQKLKALATTKKGEKRSRSQRSFDPNRSSYRIDKSIKIDQGIEVDPKSDNSENPYLQFSDEFTCANPNGISFLAHVLFIKMIKKRISL